jgi:hypothetical protein
MVRVVESDETSPQAGAPHEVPAAKVQEALLEILKSVPFRSSKQSQDLLRHIVDNSLSGHGERLKERVIGSEVFGRPLDYDTNADPIVRARVAEVRKRLALYYQTEHVSHVRISVPPGSFKATFERVDEPGIHAVPPTQVPLAVQNAVEPAIATHHEEVAEARKPQRKKLRIGLWAVAVAAVGVIAAVLIVRNAQTPQERSFNHFWSPILDNQHMALIYVGGNAVYQLSPAYLDDYHRQHPPNASEEMGFETFIQWPPGTKIDAKDLYPAKDTFVTIGDVAAITKIEALLVRRKRGFDIRYGEDVSYGDLRQSPTILIGAHNNSWTLAMTGSLRYVFSGRNSIVDRSNPQKRWTTDESFKEDYAIVSRIMNSRTDTPVFTIAGVGYAGTQAAADFVTTPQPLYALVRTLPGGWEKKNLQIVLHTSVTNQLPGTPEVVATYCW